MVKLTKRQKSIKELTIPGKEYALKEAVQILKKGPAVKFDQTIEISIKLGLDQSTNPIRGMVNLPNGIGKKVRVAVFCKGELVKEAQEAGADYVGADDLIKKISEGWLDFDAAVTTPDMMRDLAKLGKVLGPRGLMPNPKSGTVTQEIGKIVKELKSGKIEYRMDKQSGVKGPVGKLSFSENALEENISSFIKAVIGASPKLQRMQNVKSIAVSSTMGPGVMLDKDQFK